MKNIILSWLWKCTRYLFYLVGPSESTYENVSDVPRYIIPMIPFFVLLVFLEQVVRFFQGRPILRVNDTVACVSQSIFQEIIRILGKSFEILIYCFIFDHFRIVTLPWNSFMTWWICFFATDLGFYLGHRLSHEVNFIWAVHEVHHSSEDYHMICALRQSALMAFVQWFGYAPLALFGIPPSIFVPHLQIAEIYQFWLHTEIIKTLGPLEYVLNTPSHHRVHHARNRKYIDKNYGAVLIVWDRIFGTFEKEDEPVVYGVTKPLRSFNPFTIQFRHWVYIYNKMKEVDGIWNKICVPFKGPGWAPGKPRLGCKEDIPLIEEPVIKYNPSLPIWCQAYVVLHFALTVLFYHDLESQHQIFPTTKVMVMIVFLLYSITSLAFIMDKKSFAPASELFRCFLVLQLQFLLFPSTKTLAILDSHISTCLSTIRSVFIVSAVVWSFPILKSLRRKTGSKYVSGNNQCYIAIQH